MEIAVQIALNAIIAGAIYSLVAIGFTLIYSVARFFDLGYGALAVVGGYTVYYFYNILGVQLIPAIILGVVFAAVLGVLIETFLYRPLRARKSSNTVMLVASLGVLTVVQAIVAMIFTSQFQTLSRAGSETQVYSIFGGMITETQLVILATALLIMTGLVLVLRFSLFGKAIRAIADDEEVANIVGINAKRIMAYVFIIGSAIAGLAGIGTGFDTGLQPTIGFSLLLKAVVASIIGGIGSIYGAVLGAFLLAIIENLGAWQFSGEWKDAIAFAVLIAFLLFRPQGILGKK